MVGRTTKFYEYMCQGCHFRDRILPAGITGCPSQILFFTDLAKFPNSYRCILNSQDGRGLFLLKAKSSYGRWANSHSTAELMISSSEEEVGCHPKVEIKAEGSATSRGGSPGRLECISIIGVTERRAAMA